MTHDHDKIERTIREGHNASISGYFTIAKTFLREEPFNPAIRGTYYALVHQMLVIVEEGAKALANPQWQRSIDNFRAAHRDSLSKLTDDLCRMRDSLPERDYTDIKRAVLRLRIRRPRHVGEVRPDSGQYTNTTEGNE